MAKGETQNSIRKMDILAGLDVRVAYLLVLEVAYEAGRVIATKATYRTVQ
jgi:hypothetical protein